HRYVHSTTISNLLGFIVVFWAFLLAGALIGKVFSKLFKWTGLSWLDRLVGALFGAVRGALISVACIAVLMACTSKPLPNWMVNSNVLPYPMNASETLAALAPNAIRDAFRESMRDLRKIWDEQYLESRRKLEALKSASKKNDSEKKR